MLIGSRIYEGLPTATGGFLVLWFFLVLVSLFPASDVEEDSESAMEEGSKVG